MRFLTNKEMGIKRKGAKKKRKFVPTKLTKSQRIKNRIKYKQNKLKEIKIQLEQQKQSILKGK